MRQRNLIISLLGSAALLLSACGDVGSKPASNSATGGGIDIRNSGTGPGTGFGGYDSGIDANKSVAATTTQERAAACSSFQDYVLDQITVEELTEFSCTVFGFSNGAGAGSDQEAVAICNETVAECVGQNEDFDFGCPFDDIVGCEVTVGQAEVCFNAQVEAVLSVQDQFVCSNASTDPQELEDFSFELPECEAVNSCENSSVVMVNSSTEPGTGG